MNSKSSDDSGLEGLAAIRNKIDALDKELLKLFNQRAKYAEEVAVVKLAEKESLASGEEVVFYRPEREAQVLRKVMAANDGPLRDEDVAFLFRELMSSCLALEKPLKVAFLGPEGTYAQTAALKHFGQGMQGLASPAIDEVFHQVESNNANYGVVPIENSTEGMVNLTLDNFIESNVKICGEVELPIHHAFLMRDAKQFTSLKKIYSHQQSLAQCRNWLDLNCPSVERIPVNSNAEAARLASEEEGVAAIAGEVNADIYDLTILHKRIEDNLNNSTRFFIIGKEKVDASGSDKTSLIVSMRDKPGALYELLKPFYEKGISLTRIETRPMREGSWTYLFFVDFDGHQSEEPAKSVLESIEDKVVELRVLGSYPKAAL